ncbi:small-conductance mechanosensitive ion channel MscS [Klebsiella pneumoniae]|nr:small-conductance mechanosensitive ion channel MscS [Klebsiella pneumoniae]
MAYVNHLLTFIESNPALAVGFNLILLLLSGIFAHLLCKFLLIKVVRKVFFSSHKQDVPLEKDRRIAESCPISFRLLSSITFCSLCRRCRHRW